MTTLKEIFFKKYVCSLVCLPTYSFELILFSNFQFLSNITRGIVVEIKTSPLISVSPFLSPLDF